MKRKILIIGVFILLWMSLAGQYLNEPSYSGNFALLGLFRLCGMSVTMMIAPAIYKLLKKPLHKSWKFCKWNCIVVVVLWFVMNVVVYGGIYDETFQDLGANVVYALAFYYINTRLFFHKAKPNYELKEYHVPQQKICFCRKCGEKLADGATYCSHCGTRVFTEE